MQILKILTNSENKDHAYSILLSKAFNFIRIINEVHVYKLNTLYLSTGHLYFSKFWRSYVLVLTPLLLIPVALSSAGEGSTGEEMRCAYVVMIMAIYWVSEALPLEVTSLIPMVGFPLLGIMSTVCINFDVNPNLHKRLNPQILNCKQDLY